MFLLSEKCSLMLLGMSRMCSEVPPQVDDPQVTSDPDLHGMTTDRLFTDCLMQFILKKLSEISRLILIGWHSGIHQFTWN